MIGVGDSITLSRLTSLLGAKGKNFQVRSELNSTLDDLRNSPAVLIGGFNNEWTMRLTQGHALHIRYRSKHHHAAYQRQAEPIS